MLLTHARVTRLAMLILSCFGLSVTPLHAARATLMTWSFEGIVRDVINPGQLTPGLGSLGVGVGAPVSGYVRFETTTPGLNDGIPGASTNSFPGAVTESALTV